MAGFSLFCHRCEDGLLDMDRELRIELSWSKGLFCHVLIHHANHIGSGERSLSGKEFIGDTAQSILITFLTGSAAKLLWCHIQWGTGKGALPDTTDGSKHFCNTKISQEGLSLTVEQDICRFEVTMHHMLLMNILKSLSHLDENGDGFFHWQWGWALMLETLSQ